MLAEGAPCSAHLSGAQGWVPPPPQSRRAGQSVEPGSEQQVSRPLLHTPCTHATPVLLCPCTLHSSTAYLHHCCTTPQHPPAPTGGGARTSC